MNHLNWGERSGYRAPAPRRPVDAMVNRSSLFSKGHNCPVTDLVGEMPAEFERPLPHRFMADGDAGAFMRSASVIPAADRMTKKNKGRKGPKALTRLFKFRIRDWGWRPRQDSNLRHPV
jgi:hypothetical protein